jgi:hypothetical protein
MQYEWYKEVFGDEPLEQGDIIEKCKFFIPEPDIKYYNTILADEETKIPIPVDVREENAIILSQSCDIINKKIDSIILCPIFAFAELTDEGKPFYSPKEREILRRGNSPAHHLLNKFKTENRSEDFYVVNFHIIYSAPKNFIEAIIKNKTRKRLLPPYREHLSQSFARYFMRVGLPTDIPADDIKNYSSKKPTSQPPTV